MSQSQVESVVGQGDTGAWGAAGIGAAGAPNDPAMFGGQQPPYEPPPVPDSPFTFAELPPPDPRAPLQYTPLNGRELGHILYQRTKAALGTHFLFQPGLTYKEAEFSLHLNISLPDAGTTESKLAEFTTFGRTGAEVLARLLERFGTALTNHFMFQEGLSYKTFVARIGLRCDRAGEPAYVAAVAVVQVGADDSPDRLRLAHSLPIAIVLPQDAEPDAPPPDDPLPDGARRDLEVGFGIYHPEFNDGKLAYIQRIDAEGLHVMPRGGTMLRKITVGSRIYNEAKIGRRKPPAESEA